MAIALRPRPSASAISSQCGSQALAVGARPGGDGRPGSVDTAGEVAGLTGPSRWTPPVWWPVVAATRWVGRRARVPGSRPPSDRRSPSPAEPRWRARCGGATIPVAPAPVLAVWCRPRRCSAKEHAFSAGGVNVSAATGGGRFSGVHQWPVLGVHRGLQIARYRERRVGRKWKEHETLSGHPGLRIGWRARSSSAPWCASDTPFLKGNWDPNL